MCYLGYYIKDKKYNTVKLEVLIAEMPGYGVFLTKFPETVPYYKPLNRLLDEIASEDMYFWDLKPGIYAAAILHEVYAGDYEAGLIPYLAVDRQTMQWLRDV